MLPERRIFSPFMSGGKKKVIHSSTNQLLKAGETVTWCDAAVESDARCSAPEKVCVAWKHLKYLGNFLRHLKTKIFATEEIGCMFSNVWLICHGKSHRKIPMIKSSPVKLQFYLLTEVTRNQPGHIYNEKSYKSSYKVLVNGKTSHDMNFKLELASLNMYWI